MREHEENDCDFRNIRCKYSNDGCAAMAKKSDIRGHEDNCSFRKIKCKNSEHGCELIAKMNIIKLHESYCTFRKMRCRYSEDGCEIIAKVDTIWRHEYGCDHRKIKCKNSVEGCDFTGKKDIMTEHDNNCNFRKIKCPDWMCIEKIPFKSILDHLKSKHKAIIIPAFCHGGGSSGRGTAFWKSQDIPTQRVITLPPCILNLEGNTFLLLCVIERGMWKNRVVIVGSKEDADRYSIEINIPGKDASRTTTLNMELSFKGKIHSILEDKQLIKVDEEGVLDFTTGMAKNMLERDTQGKLGIRTEYVIYDRGLAEGRRMSAPLTPLLPASSLTSLIELIDNSE